MDTNRAVFRRLVNPYKSEGFAMRRRVVAMLGQKGGSGKSTVGVSLAVEAIRAGKTVTIIDIDPQQTSSKWGDRRGGSSPTVVSAQAERLTKTLEGIDPDHLVIIDTAGKADREGIAVSKVADLILLPSRPLIAGCRDSWRNLRTVAPNRLPEEGVCAVECRRVPHGWPDRRSRRAG